MNRLVCLIFVMGFIVGGCSTDSDVSAPEEEMSNIDVADETVIVEAASITEEASEIVSEVLEAGEEMVEEAVDAVEEAVEAVEEAVEAVEEAPKREMTLGGGVN